MNRKTIAVLGGGLTCLIVAVALLVRSCHRPPTALQQDKALQAALEGIVEDYRKIIVLMDGAESLDEKTRARCQLAGRTIFYPGLTAAILAPRRQARQEPPSVFALRSLRLCAKSSSER